MPKDISEIREEKKEKLKRKVQEQGKEQQEQAEKQANAIKKQMLKKALTKEARERLGRIRAANPEKAEQLGLLVIKVWRSGQIQGKIDDDKFKQLLKQISSNKRETNIKRR
ncbi:MAG: DNA-binding protein [archaeon]